MPACTTKGVATAKAMTSLPEARDKAFDAALAQATQPATTAKAFAQAHCTRPHGLSGENTEFFPRVYTQGRNIAYLVALPVKGAADPSRLYGLIKVWGSGAVRVDALFDAIPTDEKLAPVAADFSDGGFDPLNVDAKTGQLVDHDNVIPVYLQRAADIYRSGKSAKPAT
jgi:hypothetical protein